MPSATTTPSGRTTQFEYDDGLRLTRQIPPEATGRQSEDERATDLAWDDVARPPIVEVEVRNSDDRTEIIETTSNHPFFVEDQGWKDVADLELGDTLLNFYGGRAQVESVYSTNRLETVYNFGVAGTGTYFVGEGGVWVHNSCNRLRPNPDAVGPHTVFKRNPETGRVSGYTTFEHNPRSPNHGGFVPQKRFRGEGKPHGPVDPPLVHHQPPGSGIGASLTETRAPLPWELPSGY